VRQEWIYIGEIYRYSIYSNSYHVGRIIWHKLKDDNLKMIQANWF